MLKSGLCSNAKMIAGESLSSWSYRLCQIPEVQQYILHNAGGYGRGPRLFLSLFEFEKREAHCDLDFISPDHKWKVLPLIMGSDLERFVKPVNVAPMIPWGFRRSYCEDCMRENLRSNCSLMLKIAWRYVSKPFCELHDVLLKDVPRQIGAALDAPRAIFKWNHSIESKNLGHAEYVNNWADLLKTACRVQKKLVKLRNLQQDRCIYLFDNTIMSLMRALLTPGMDLYRHSGSNRLLDIVSSEGETLYLSCYLQPFRASAACRARAHFFIGILLGWVCQKEAFKSLRGDPWESDTPEKIWGSVYKFDKELYYWLRNSLIRFQTSALSICTPQFA